VQHFKASRGFTLIEILIVISIIAILAGITITAVGPARVKGRDAQRISDLNNIRIALALYKSANGKYPILTSWVRSTTDSQWTMLRTPLKPYIALPIDPINKLGWANGEAWNGPPGQGKNLVYEYRSTGDGSRYDLVTQLEDRNSPYRCKKKGWIAHSSGAGTSYWCPPFTPSLAAYSEQLYADH